MIERIQSPSIGGSIAVLQAFNVKELIGGSDLLRATILLFFFFGFGTAGMTYCLSYLFKSAATAQLVIVFFNVSRFSLSYLVLMCMPMPW